MVRNVAFEATREDIQNLFKSFADLKSVRMPKKNDGGHRGFAFVDFMSIDEANKAFRALQNTHLYGRKLNFEWAAAVNADSMVQLN
jgi:multiple RNA-binding domain-containing protein 1